MRIRQSNNKHQWFVEVDVDGAYKIAKVFYTKDKCVEYTKSMKKEKK